MTRKLGCLLIVLMAGSHAFAASVGMISGYVKDSSGAPQMGAVVDIFTSAAVLGTTVYSDSRGFYSASNLQPGTYQVKVSATSFLPTLRENVSLRAGAHVLVNVTLSTLTDALKLLPPRRPATSESDDWHWTLRSAANRPVLRALQTDEKDGSMVVISTPEREEDRSLKARVAFIAGSQADGFGSAGDMTTAFALEKSLFNSGTLSFNGNIGTASGDPTGVLRTSYAHDFGESSRPTITLTYRRFAAPGLAADNSPYAAMEINSSDRMSVAGFVDVEYGAALQSMEFAKRVTALRPYGSVDVHLSPDLLVEYRYATSEPDTRSAKGFDSAPADLSESGPRMALNGGRPQVETARHQEMSVSRRMGDTNVQIAAYMDRIHNLVLTGAGEPGSDADDILRDVYSGTFSYAYTPGLSTNGVRVVIQRKITGDLTATLDYANGSAITAEALGAWQNLAQSLASSRQNALGGKVAGFVPVSRTRWICSYKWTSGNALSSVDAFNASPGQMDPYLSIFIRQPLPSSSLMPAKMEAMLDLRNVLAQGYQSVTGQDGRTLYMLQSARSLRGGLAFTF